MKEVKSLGGLAGPNASLKDAGAASASRIFVPIKYGCLAYPSNEDLRYGVAFSSDGSMMYFLNTNSGMRQRSLSTPFNARTGIATIGEVTLSGLNVGRGIFLSSDDTRLFVVDEGSDSVRQYTSSGTFDVTSYSASGSFSISSQALQGNGISFKPDGSVMFVGSKLGEVFEYTLSTPWDVTTASHSSSYNFNSEIGNGEQLCITRDGTNAYFMVNNTIRHGVMTTPWDFNTISFYPDSLLRNILSFAIGSWSCMGLHPNDYALYTGDSVNDTHVVAIKGILSDESYLVLKDYEQWY